MVDRRNTPARTRRPVSMPRLDKIVHGRVRLGILSALAVNECLRFNDLKELLNTTDGNLSAHARKLEEAGYIACRKFFDDRTPATEYRITTSGQKAFRSYLDQMELLIRSLRRPKS